MPKMIITGGKTLNGDVFISGAKNSVLPLLAATLLCDGEVKLYNCPDISDVENSLHILNSLGIETSFKDDCIIVNGRTPINTTISENMMRKMRSSVVFVGSILARRGKAVISTPGGCELGPRPIDIHIDVLKSLGATVIEDRGKMLFTVENGLKGNTIDLKLPSVGATETAIFAAVTAQGTTVINNAAREPEIGDLIDFLNKAGADILGKNSSTITIKGVNKLNGVSHRVIPDRIEAATFMAAVGSASGSITLHNVIPAHLESVTEALTRAGCKITVGDSTLGITAPKSLKSVCFIKSLPYPSFPTDAGPMICAALSKADGNSVFCEGIFENRFRYISELIKMGADIKIEGNIAVINGKPLFGAECKSFDLRGGAAVVVAALGARGTTVLSNIEFLNRGYDNLSEKLALIGADIYIKE